MSILGLCFASFSSPPHSNFFLAQTGVVSVSKWRVLKNKPEAYVQGGWLVLILRAPSKTRKGVGTGPSVMFGAQNAEWAPQMGPFFLVFAVFMGSKKTWTPENTNNIRKTRNELTKNACCLKHTFSRVCFSPKEKCTLQKSSLFAKIFGNCKWARGPFEDQGGCPFRYGGAVRVCGEFHRVSNGVRVFSRYVFER